MLRTIVILMLMFASFGCSDQKAQRQAFLQREGDTMEGYYNPDITVAEASLLSLIEIELEGQRRGYFKGDVDWVLGLTHGRLYLIYTQMGRESDAEAHMAKALAYMDASFRYRGRTPPESEQEKRTNLLSGIKRLDQNREVRWKK